MSSNLYWNFRNSTIENNKIDDIILDQSASLVNFVQSDINDTGLEFKNMNKYVDFGTNTINIGNNYTIETLLKMNLDDDEINTSDNWSQIGNNIIGETNEDRSGYSTSLSSDGSIIAIGAIQNNSNQGHVRVYKNTDGTWNQLGQDIDGETQNDYFGSSVALSADGTILACGGLKHDSNKGHVRIFQYNGSTWNQLGTDIDGEIAEDESPTSLAISYNGSIIAISSINNNSNLGHVRIFSYTNSSWSQLGSEIIGTVVGEHFGRSISLSSDGTIISIGVSLHDSDNKGTVRVFEYTNNDWSQIGSDIDGPSYSEFGWSSSLSSDGTIIAIGGLRYDSYNGIVKVYKYLNNSWSQLGSDIVGNSSTDGGVYHISGGVYHIYNGSYNSNSLWNECVGWSCSLSSNGKVLIVGAINGDNTSSIETGSAKVYYFENDTWNQIGQTLYGDSYLDKYAWSVSISSNGKKVAIGVPHFSTSSIGIVKIFSLPELDLSEQTLFSFGDSDTNKLELNSGTSYTSLKWISSGTIYDISTSNVFSDFSNIKVVFDNSMNFYIDNSHIGSVNIPSFTSDISFAYNYLGRDLSNSENFNGNMSYFSIYKNDYNILDLSASAVFYISQQDVQNVFKVRTSETDISNISYSELLHFIHMDQWPTNLILNPFNAVMNNDDAILSFWNSSKMTVKHDYIRYLSQKLFNNPHCVSMFNNETQLVNSIENIGSEIYQSDISSVFWKFSTDSSHTQDGFIYDSVTGKKATNNTIITNDNICRQLLNTILQNAFSRFDNIADVMDSSGVFPLPILQGDTISFETSLNPTETQHLLTSTNDFGGRTYKIKLIIN
tara:strand:+ start:3204 stop:5699 length:2496 start_codon:yes stop_codon:yes gene_type:complete